MSEIKTLDKLREFAETNDGYSWASYLIDYADAIEAEIAANYLELPKDADGVPIHACDICEMSGEQFEVRQLTTDGDCWWAVDRLGEFYIAELCHHVKQRTLEDVLRDVWTEALDYAKSDIWRNPDEVFAERADEIRELAKSDEKRRLIKDMWNVLTAVYGGSEIEEFDKRICELFGKEAVKR